jgi:hypothetical protein
MKCFKFVIIVVMCLVILAIINLSLKMISEASTVANVLGVCFLALLAGLFPSFIKFTQYLINKHEKKN